MAGVPSLTYLRKEVTIPDPVPQGRASIYLGQVEKMDTVYVNGRQVGSSSWVENPRVYGAMGLKQGKNIITIRLFRVNAEGSGFIDGAASMKLVLGDGTAIPLAGEWKGKVSVDGHTPGVLPPGYESVTSDGNALKLWYRQAAGAWPCRWATGGSLRWCLHCKEATNPTQLLGPGRAGSRHQME